MKSLPKREENFVFHLEEFRRRVLLCLTVFSVAAVFCYFFSRDLLEFLIAPLTRYQEAELIFQKPYEAFLTHLKAAALAGFFIASPVLFFQLWLFIAPGLYEKEKKTVLPFIFVTVLLFLAGAYFAYAVVIPWGLYFLLSFQTESLKPLLSLGAYFSFLMGMLLAFGILFDFPIVIVGLVRLGVVSTDALKKTRKVIIVILFILAAILTPSPDPISQLLLALPLLLLFEISLLVARWGEKKRVRGKSL